MRSYLKFTPIYQERVWGGRGLEEILGRQLPGDTSIGESWELVDRPEADSLLTDSTESLGTLRREQAADLMGPGWSPNEPFPILVKWLDCQERLSLQVHPPASVAGELGGEPKTENWYIVKAEPGAALLAGLKPGVTEVGFREALEAEQLENLVCRLPSKAGDSLFVPSGRLHAIDAGNLILEIQQNSDTTYRVYDWGRVGLDGQPRELHVQESMRSIAFEDTEPELLHPGGKESLLADCEAFRIRRLELEAGEEFRFPSGVEPSILSLVEGALVADDGGTASRGENLILPYVGDSTWIASRRTVVLVTDHFNPLR